MCTEKKKKTKTKTKQSDIKFYNSKSCNKTRMRDVIL